MGNLCQMTPGMEQIKYQTQLHPPQTPHGTPQHGYQQPLNQQPTNQQQYLQLQANPPKTYDHQQNKNVQESILYNSWYDNKEGKSNLLQKPQQPFKLKMTDSVMM